MSKWHWTIDEINSCPLFGQIGWFYGLVIEKRIPRLVEIFPGQGYAKAWPRNPKWMLRAANDVLRTKRLKEAHSGVRNLAQQAADERQLQEEIKHAKPLSEIKR